MKAHEVLNPNAVFLHPGQTIGEASRLMLERGVNRAAILNNNHECMGVVSKDLLLEVLLKGLSQETEIQEIMQRHCYNLAFDNEVSLDHNNQEELRELY